jgi:uncharacterized protein with HEPN domain
VKDDHVYLLHVRDATHRILRYAGDGKQGFFPDTKTQDAHRSKPGNNSEKL